MKTIHDHIEEKTALAKSYAEDGAFHSAARVLKDLEAVVKFHADACDKELEQAMRGEGLRR